MPEQRQSPTDDSVSDLPAQPPGDGAGPDVPLTPLINVSAKKPPKKKKRKQKSKPPALNEVPREAEETPVYHPVPEPERTGARKPEPAAKALVADAAETTPQQEEEEEEGEESLEWRRKAQSRRMKALRPKGETKDTGPSEDYLPAFTARRLLDASPEFDQPSEALAVSPKPNPYGLYPGLAVSLLIAGCTLGIVLIVWTAGLLKKSGEPETMRKATGLPADQSDLAEEVVHRRAAEEAPEAIAVVREFFDAKTLEEKAKLVRGGEVMLPWMRDYYSLHPDEPGSIKVDNSIEFKSDGDREFVKVTGSSASGFTFDTWVERTSAGPRLDWRFLTGTGEMEWDRWIKDRPQRPVSMRVIARLDDYYGGPFGDPKEWISVKITDISLGKTVWAYVERVSDMGLNLWERMAGGRRAIRMVGSFEFPAVTGPFQASAAGTPQVLIRSVQDGVVWLDRSPEVTGGTPAGPRVSNGP